MPFLKTLPRSVVAFLAVAVLALFGLSLAACGDETATAYAYGTATAAAGPSIAAAKPTTVAGTGTPNSTPVATATVPPTPTLAATPALGSLTLAYPGAKEVTLKPDSITGSNAGFVENQPNLAITKTQAFVTSDSLDKIAAYYDGQFKSASWVETQKLSGASNSFFETFKSKATDFVALSAQPVGPTSADEVSAVAKSGDNVIVLSQGLINAYPPPTAAPVTTPSTIAAGAATCTLGTPPAETNKKYFSITLEKGGTISGELYPDLAPQTVAHIIALANEGFYNGLTFHRVEPGFVIQGGDPRGDGTGGSGTPVPDSEFTTKYKHQCGSMAMAHAAAANSGDSQFYILTAPNATSLDGKYTIFGQVTGSMDVVFKVQIGDKIKTFTVSDTKPS